MNQTEESNSSWTVVSNKRSPKKTTQSTNTNVKMNIDAKKKPAISKATRPFVIKEEISIDPDTVGFVAGRNGCNLKRLKKIYEVSFILPPKEGSQLIIEGPIEMVSAARKDIEQNLLCKTSFFVDNKYRGQFIGHEGETIRALQDALNVRVWMKEDGEVVVTGKRCEEAKKSIEEILFRKTSFFIEKEYCHLVAGPNGANLWALRTAHNVDIDMEEDGEVVIIGKESVEAKKTIESMIESFKTDYPYQEKFSVPSDLIRFICGKNGSNIKRIESAHNVRVFIPAATTNVESQMVVVKGSDAGNVSTAKQHIIGTILDLDEILVERIIGTRWESVRRIGKEYDVSIRFDKMNQGRNGRQKVYIVGEKSRTKAAKEDIISIITGRKNG